MALASRVTTHCRPRCLATSRLVSNYCSKNLIQYQSNQQRQFSHNSSPKTIQTLAATDAHNGSKNSESASKLRYLETLPTSDLISYLFIGLATTNRATLNLVVKLFPYIPMPLIKTFVSKIYCGGDTAGETVVTGKKLAARGINNMMLSFTLEDAEGTKNLDINHVVGETIKSIDSILIPHTESVFANIVANGGIINQAPAAYIALKPSALVANPADVMRNWQNPEFKPQWDNLVGNLSKICQHIYKRNAELAAKYPDRTAPALVAVVDAEKFELQQAVYDLQRTLFKKFNPLDKPACVVGTVQMYLKQSYDIIVNEKKLGQEQGYKVGLKLVRGAYIHSEPDRGVIHDTKSDTDVNYNRGIKYSIEDLFSGKDATIDHLVIASHNRDSMLNATDLLEKYGKASDLKYRITLAQLLGMADDITYDLITNHNVTNIIKYVPWGPPLETKDYLRRRLEENGDAVRNDNGLPLVKGVLSAIFKRLFK
ncbi:proline dehydrogenase [Saccharomycopsis crataegensis]|uniref:Proline dehydrogenase n=1 Tax=Saccharomycopsis crataegensis TaxID=43959 RepID=A0AAV5QRU8_9ASCO|nr:proline dehydrogenase [Saccharomycopsis crataegensis]